MAKAKTLTAAAVAKFKPAAKRREIPDAGAPGLHLVIQPSGGKSWALRYRRPNRQPAKFVLGSVYDKEEHEPETKPVVGGHLTLAGARRLVAEQRHLIAQGRDPGAEHMADRKRQRMAAVEGAANTFGAAARDFVEKHARQEVRRWREQSRLLGLRPDDLTPIPRGLAERWGERPLAEISGDGDIKDLIKEVRKHGAPGLERRADGETESRARAMFSCLAKMFDWLIEHDRIRANPCTGVPRPAPPKTRDRVLSNAEIVKFWSAADAERKEFGAVLKLLLLTGCRLNEVVGMRREELSDGGATWTIPGTRTKNKRVHVVPLARELIAGVGGDEELIFTTDGRSRVNMGSRIKLRLDAAMKIPAWRVHDLRRTAATGMAEIGIQPHIVEACLNHAGGAKAGVAGTYNRAAYAAEKKVALERWAAHVASLIDGREAKVLDMHRAARARQ
jgi:integrase